MFQFLIMLVVYKLKDRDAIVDLKPKGVEQVVDNYHIFEVAVLDDTKVLDEEPVFGLHAVLPGEHIADVLVLWIDVVDDRVGVVLGGSRENNDLIFLTHVLQKLH